MPRTVVTTTFRPSDDILRQLVAARREEVLRLQKSQADHLEDLETRGRQRIASLRGTLPGNLVTVLDELDKTHDEASAATRVARGPGQGQAGRCYRVTGKRNRRPSGFGRWPSGGAWLAGLVHPLLRYTTLHGSDGTVYWQGYNPGNIDLSDHANGAGSGIFGTGAGSFTVYMDWWFTYNAPADRNYGHAIWVPFHGFYILYSDDGFWDSKEAHARIDLSAVGYQYNYKATGSTNVFDLDSQNINVNDRFDGWRTMYYSDLLGADRAYLRVSASFYVYARGGGSTAQLNFSDGNANYMGVPWVYVD